MDMSTSTHGFGAGDYHAEGQGQTADIGMWYPRVVSSYGLTERVNWSRHLEADRTHRSGYPAQWMQPMQSECRDYYGSEDVDAAFLRRKPVSFAIFGKPGLADERLAAMLSAHWGCVHVSAATGLLAASHRPDDKIGLALRRGEAVNAADTATQLFGLLGIDGLEVRERGYVLTGLPRHCPELSACEQMSVVFATNPPDVLIYMSCRNQDLIHIHKGLTLESMEHDHLTQTLHLNNAEYNHRRIHWYNKSFINKEIIEMDLKDYENYSLNVINEIVKQFDPTCVITLDGRKPVNELFETIKAKLITMSLQYTVLPEIVKFQKKPSMSENYEYDGFESEFELESNEAETVASGVDRSSDTTQRDEKVHHVNNRNEQIRLRSEFGRLCPVNFSNGRFILGSDRYCMKFMGKLYYFSGPDEMQSFGKCPKQFLKVPGCRQPIRAMFYGPQTLTNPAAKAVRKFFGYNLIDVGYIMQIQKETTSHAYSLAIVGSIIKTAQEDTKPKKIRPNDINTMRNAIADWTRLRFGITVQSDLNSVEDDGIEYEMYEDSSNQKKQHLDELFKRRQLIRLKNFFESYDIDFLDDLNACVHAFDKPESLTKYFQNMSKNNRKIFRSSFIKKAKIVQPEIINVIVDTIRIKNQQNINWIIVNAPLDFELVKKLIDENLNPIQMVFFHDSDPMHNILLLNDEMSNSFRTNCMNILENVKNDMRYGTAVERIKYPEFVNQIENKTDISKTEDDIFEDEFKTVEHEENIHIDYMSNDLLMEIIVPEIIERLKQYTENLLVQWYTLRNQISNETDQYNIMNFNIIVCEPNSITNSLKMLIEETLYYIKKFLTDNVYDVSTSDIDDTVPTRGKYDGDTSIYCPVRFANGKLSIGSKQHMAVYHNRYYYMSSSDDFKAFISNPHRYTLFSNIPKMNPKPKISLLFSFGLSLVDFIKEILDKFDLTLVDSYKVFKQNVLPSNMPMVGKMYEEPMLKKIVDKYFIPKNQKDNINNLRKYMDKESAYLNDEDWFKMNSFFFQANEGICYKNYPKSLTELKYLKENAINPDVIIEVTSKKHIEKENARLSVIQNWLTYQYILIDKIIARDTETRQESVNNRSVLFKQKLAELMKQKEMHRVKIRLEYLIKMIIEETTVEGPNAVKSVCESQNESNKSFRKSTLTSVSDFLSRYHELTLKQKKIIINHGLDVSDFLDLDDFATLDEIDEMVNNEFPDGKYMISQCFSDRFEFPSDDIIEQHLDAEKNELVAMREFAEESNIPWITMQTDPDSRSTVLSDIANVLPENPDGLFETTYNVDLETAENMLRAGEVHLSRFGRWCPVQAVLGSDYPSIRKFCPDLTEGRVHPVVHRKYVYYVAGGPEDRDEFARHPLKYVLGPSTTPPPSPPPSFPLKIAVVGPPGSGKSRCTRELCSRFGLQLIRIEDAVEEYLTEYRWTDVARLAVGMLRRGDALSEDALAEMVTTATFGSRATTWGYVIDGYPVTEKQFKLLDSHGVMLHAVFVLREDGSRPEESVDDETALSRFRRAAWTAAFAGLPGISARYGNAAGFETADADGMAAAVSECVRSVLAYRTDVHRNRPSRLSGVPVTGHEYRYNLSTYLDLCPVCKADDGCLNRPSDPAALRRSAVQYQAYIYWTCGPKHEAAFTSDPDRYAGAAPDSPHPHPVPTTDYRLSRNPYFRCNLLSKYCVVCALSCLWYPTYRRGRPELMATYGNRAYTFCSSRCQQSFTRRPSLYSEYTMLVRGPERSESSSPPQGPWDRDRLEGLPVPGYLEQTVSARISSALAGLTAVRPVHPGLTATVTAMVYIGLHLGMNSGGDKDVVEYYRDAFKRFVDTCHSFKIEAFKLKSLT